MVSKIRGVSTEHCLDTKGCQIIQYEGIRKGFGGKKGSRSRLKVVRTESELCVCVCLCVLREFLKFAYLLLILENADMSIEEG